ncbi:MAG: hypothetical protein E6K16_01875 [Methanobacteriota archaeon]|nr:MAG: hypothetical protein E6K16_01875 [Euryarchaeota archaeon]
MGTKTISLEDSAYEKLRGAKRPGESFSDVVRRILGGREPSFSDFRGIVDRRGVKALAEAVAKMREEDIRVQKGRQSGRR